VTSAGCLMFTIAGLLAALTYVNRSTELPFSNPIPGIEDHQWTNSPAVEGSFFHKRP